MNVLFSPATVPLTSAPLAWPSKLKTRKYLPPYISSPNRVIQSSSRINLPGINFRQSFEVPNPQQIFGGNNRPINGNVQSIGNNFQQQPNVQQKKPYISPNLRNKNPVESSDGIDVRMDKSSDEIPTMNLVETISTVQRDETELENSQTFNDSNEKEDLPQNEPILEQTVTPIKQENISAPKRQFLVSVINPVNDELPKQTSEEKKSGTSNEKLLIMNQAKEDSNQRDSQESQEVKNKPIDMETI